MSNLEPDLGESTTIIDRLRQSASTPTITPASTTPAISPLAPRLPDELQAKITGLQNGTITPPTTPTPSTGLDTSAIITNLPDARKSFVTKYTRLKKTITALPEPVRKSIIQMDLDRAEKGQSPMNDQETLAAIVTTLSNKPATKPPEDKSILGQITAIPGNIVEDTGGILKSIPSMLVPNRGNVLYKEAVAAGKIAADAFTHNAFLGNSDEGQIREMMDQAYAEGKNPVEAFMGLPLVRLLPGSFTAGNLAGGGEGLSNIAKHPVGTALDVLPYAGKAAGATKVGKIAVAEDAANIARVKPLRAVLTRKVLPEGELTLRGSQLTPAKFGRIAEAGSRTGLGRWMSKAFGEDSRAASRILNLYDAQFVEAVQGTRPLSLPDQQFARRAFTLAAEDLPNRFPDITPERVKAVTAALETDRNMVFTSDAFSDAERALASRAIKLQPQPEDLNVGDGNVMRFYDEVYDAKTGKAIKKAQEKLDNKANLVDEGLFDRVAKARNDLIDRQATGTLSTADRHVLKKLDPLYAAMDDYFNNPNTSLTLQDLNKKARGLVAQRTRLGGAGEVGQRAAAKGDIRLDTLARIRGELKDAAKAEKNLQAIIDRAPARWIPNIQLMAKDKAHKYLVGKGIDPVEATRMIAERDFSIAPDIYSQKVMDKIVASTEPMWRTLKEAGLDPLFVHRVPIAKQRILSLPRLTDYATPLTQAEKRNIFNATPYTQDVTVALAHQGAELVSNAMSREAMDSIGRELGIREGVLRERVMPLARRRVKGTAHDINDVATQMLAKEFVPFQPGGFGTKLPKVLNDADRIWIPKAVADTLDRYYHPNPSELFGAVRALNGVFRTSVLPFSVRWQINNNIGGAIVTAITNPGAFKEVVNARRAIKAWREGAEGVIPEEIGYGLGSIRKEIAESKYATASFMHGERVGSLWQKVQESKIKQAGSAAAQKMYDLNSWSDETFKVMTYLNMEKKALRGGATKAAAMEEGLQAVNRYFQNWNSLTPIERQLLREVFPFYAFTSYAIRFIMNYPGTHPLRASIMANIAEAEIADFNQTLPQEMQDYLAVGEMDENGDQRFLNMRGLNPFADTANSFTLEGFLSGVNPIGQAIIKSRGGDLGYGVGAGQPTYDADTGRMTDAKPGFVDALIGSTIPQVGALQRMLGRDPEYNALLRTNPEAAQRLLVSGIGIPATGRTINIPQTQIKAELNRLRTQQEVFKRARETGDYTEARKWPALVPMIDQLERLNALGLLREYNPQAGASNSVRDAIGSVKPWPT